ncbi:MAG: hypothetical protein II996_01695 [Oscillospiraceae bacterium]|nr:hypothetical protein [Oscillospiraceae bacterium]MBQ4544269.1 hypothetical protein [Oscillospiraceae bacterium]MBQ6902201.1 hypothetical protein [Oscillospiraceae bacterium]
MEKNTQNKPEEKVLVPGTCRACGFITPFGDTNAEFCCPSCGAFNPTERKL